tara:strand:- start:2002 stop:2601 length:600 start_codon:yes stop_codon:yes gene_type:complete
MTKKELEEQLMEMPELETQEEKIDYLIAIQSELKAPKNQFNNFGKYKYRSAEDILEAVKPLLKKYNCFLTITETTQEIAGYLVLNSKVSISDGETNISVEAQAGINPERKGMDIAQSFGSSSSYAKKYALGNLFLLDDTKDADSNKVNEPIDKKERLDEIKFKAMLKALEEGKAEAVKEKLPNYILSKSQEEIINQLIK